MTHNIPTSNSSENGQTTDTASTVNADLDMLATILPVLMSIQPELVLELRIPNVPGSGTISGYFTDLPQLAAAAALHSGKAPGVYTTLNPVNPTLLARANNRVKPWAKHTTSDQDIVHRVWLPIDFDPVRPSGISALDTQHQAALERAQACQEWLRSLGWPQPILADSGNGAHVLYRIDLPNNAESTTLVKRCLEALDLQFSDDAVKVDLTTYNAARIWKLYGTRACKGDARPDRPHRMATLLEVPDEVDVVTLDQLTRLAAMVPTPAPVRPQSQRTGQAPFDLEQWLATHKLAVAKSKPWKDWRMYILNPCPWNAQHTNDSAYIIQHATGAIAAGCHHDGCVKNDWYALRELYEPGWQTRRQQRSRGSQAATAALTEAVQSLLSTVKDDRDPRHVFDAVEVLAQLSTAAFGKVKAELKDILGGKLNLNDVDRAVNEARQQVASLAGLAQDDTGRPVIDVHDRPLRNMTADAFQALAAANHPPFLFVRGGALTRVRRDEQQHLLVETLNEDHLRGILTRAADFVYGQGEKSSHAIPSRDLVRDLLAFGTYPMFPPLAGVVSSPIFRPDGTLVAQEGYDSTTRLLYLPPPEFVLPPIPDAPTPAEAQAAAQYLLQELCGDFPFTHDSADGHGSASQTHTLAMLLSCVLRPVIDGPITLALISAPQRGSGKTLLAELVVLLTTGQDASVMTAPFSDEEWRKRISAVLASGTPVAILDNIVTTLASPSLAAMLTAHTWQDRLLGRNDQVLLLPARTVWIGTANNPTVDTDLARRSFSIRLDAKASRPWQGRMFRHADIRAWTKAHRGELLAALCTMGRAWFVAGKPPASTPRLGKFEAWCETLGGVLALAQVPHFLGNLRELYDHMDPEAQQWEAFLAALGHDFNNKPFTVSEVTKRLLDGQQQRLRETLPDYLADALDGGEGQFRKRLGKAFAQHVDVRYGDAGISLTRAEKDTQKNVNRWRVERYQGPTVQGDVLALAQKIMREQSAATTPEPTGTVVTASAPSQAPVEATPEASHTTPPTETDGAGQDTSEQWPNVGLPPNRNAWPSKWQEAWEERAAILEVEDGSLSRMEAERLAEEVIRNEYRRTCGPRVTRAKRLAAELGVDLQALSIKLNTDLHLLDESHASELHLRLLQPHDEVCEALSTIERDDLVIFVSRYTNTLPS